jgi:pseudaminic acid synthase
MNKVFIIAELSANHNGSKEIAIETIRAAKRAGADAIKLQTYTADTITLNCNNDDFKIDQGTLWDGRYLYDLYKEAYTPWEWHEELFDIAKEEGMVCFSTPFDKSAVDFLESLGNPIYKIASFEITDTNLIRYAASKGKPMVISTGIATMEDIELALKSCYAVNNYDITLLKCTSAYPAPIKDANLLTINDIRTRYNVKVGLSDHTLGADIAIAAVALGATVIEKHFIKDRSLGGPDSEFSMDEIEFSSMVKSIRNVEDGLGKVCYVTEQSNTPARQFARSLYVVENMNRGDIITENNIKSIRPGFGLHPRYLSKILGKKVNRDLERGNRFLLDFVE